MKKPYLCRECGETDSNKFSGTMKGRCAACQNEINRKRYHQKLGYSDRIIKPFLCRECGETDSNEFYGNAKSICKKCQNKINKSNHKPKPFLCRECGETDSNEFYGSNKSLCGECQKKKKRYSGKAVLKRLRRFNKKIEILIHRSQKIIVKQNQNESKKLKYKTYVSVIQKNSRGEVINIFPNRIVAAMAYDVSTSFIMKRIQKNMALHDGTYLENGKKIRQPVVVDNRPKVGSQEYFEKTVVANHGDIYLLDRSKYINNETEVEIGCKKHGNYFRVQATTLLRRTERNGGMKKNPEVGSCPICRKEYFIKIKEDFYVKCREAHNNEYQYGEYVNLETPLDVYCEKHGKFVVNPYTHSSGGGKCPECYPVYPWGRKPNPLDKRVGDKRYYICDIHGDVRIGMNRSMDSGCPKCVAEKNEIDKYKKLIDYLAKNYSDYHYVVDDHKIVFTCEKHGNTETVKRTEFQMRKRGVSLYCKDCKIQKNRIKRHEARIKLEARIRKIIESQYSGHYEFLELHYKKNGNSVVKLKMLYNNKERVVTTHTILRGDLSTNTRRFPKTYLNYENAKLKMRELGINSFRQYQKWYKRTHPTTLPANVFRYYTDNGGEWVSYMDFFGTDEKSIMSKGEKRIADYLNKKGMRYEYQKKYDDCRDINPLPFDFYLPQYDILIEFDGYQHYHEVQRFGELKYVQKHDKIKTNYCLKNGITLIRIPYWELDDNVVEWTLDNEITRHAANQAIKYLNKTRI